MLNVHFPTHFLFKKLNPAQASERDREVEAVDGEQLNYDQRNDASQRSSSVPAHSCAAFYNPPRRGSSEKRSDGAHNLIAAK